MLTRTRAVVAALFCAASVSGAPAGATKEHDQHAHAAAKTAASIRIEIVPGDEEHAAGKSMTTIVRLTDKSGKPVTLDDLAVAHTEKLHLLIVDDSLTDYHHEHPAGSDKPGEYQFQFTPKVGGVYHLWADLLPLATQVQEYTHTRLQVKGEAAVPDRSTNQVATVDGITFTWETENNAPLRAGEAALVKVRVTGSDGKPFAELEPVMGAFAHMVAFPQDLQSVTHVHPAGPEPDTATARGGPELVFHVVPEQEGFHKFYLQTQIDGRDRFVAFGMQIAPAQSGGASAGTAATFTCPMHPEVKQTGPGKCPKCGMPLVAATSEDGNHKHEH